MSPAGAPWRWQLLRQPAPGMDLQQELCTDAVLVWDLLTGFARHGGPARGSHWRVMLEFTGTVPADGLAAWCALPAAAEHAATLRRALAPSLARAPQSPVHTAVLAEALLPALLAAVAAGVLLRFQQAGCCRPAPVDDGPTAAEAWPDAPSDGLVQALGLVGDGCCLAHADFRTADGRSRLAGLWDQDPAAEPTTDTTAAHGASPWRRHRGGQGAPPYRYGAELSGQAIDALLARHPGLGERAERGLYAAIGRPHWGQARQRHGAGRMHLLAGHRTLPPAEVDAARMPLLFVQLPPGRQAGRAGASPPGAARSVGASAWPGATPAEAGVSAGASAGASASAGAGADAVGEGLGFHVVDGCRWIVDRARALARDPNAWRVTIALGPGSSTGPHDGSSMAEQALDQLAADARVRLVVASGDHAATRARASARVAQDRPAQWWLRLPPGRTDDSFVQIWLPEGQPPERFQLLLAAPGLPTSPLLQLGQVALLGRADGPPVAGVVRAMRSAQGLRGHLILLALAPTAPCRSGSPPRPAAPAGLWRIELQAAGPQPAEVHAWIAQEDGAGPPPCFEPAVRSGPAVGGTASTAPGTAAAGMALGSLANGLRCTLAAGHVLHGGRLSAATALGPRRAAGHDAAALCFAPVDAGPSRPGVPVPGFFSGQRGRTGGSAAAAAQVARWLAEGRLTEPAAHWLRPALQPALPVPAEARCLPPAECGDLG